MKRFHREILKINPSNAAILKRFRNILPHIFGKIKKKLLTVPETRFELVRLAALPPQSSASTNFATQANCGAANVKR